MTVFAKDPSSTLDYSFDWTNWLAPGEAILSGSWTIAPSDAGVPVLAAETLTGAITAVNVGGGAVNSRYRLSCQITTDSGRTVERSTALRVMEV